MTRKECLDMAAQCVLQDRACQYGGMEDNFRVIANFWSVYLGRKVYPADVAMMMSLLKIARIRGNKAHADSFVDLAGYAACGAECANGKPAPKAEGNCFQNGNSSPEAEAKDEAEAEAKGMVDLAFKHGDPVEWFSFRREDAATGWHPAVYLGKAGDPDYHIVQDIDGTWRHVVNYANVRIPKAMFKPGDRVQYRVELPSVSDWIWRDATYLRPAFSWQQDGEHIVTDEELGPVTVKDKDIRPAPKAEGCEALVEKDAPQTPAELCRRIVDANPAIYGRAHKPTGEELAEMAQEDADGGA